MAQETVGIHSTLCVCVTNMNNYCLMFLLLDFYIRQIILIICLCRFATRERNALLLYNGRFNEKHDFIALEIIDEQIQLTFSGG